MSEPLRHHPDALYGVTMIAIHRSNMTPITPAEQQLLRLHHKRIETCNSQREKMGIARLHAWLSAGILRKIAASLCTLSVTNHCETSNQGIPYLPQQYNGRCLPPALEAMLDFELHALAYFECLDGATLDFTKMDKHIFTAFIGCDEAKPFAVVVRLYHASSHLRAPVIKKETISHTDQWALTFMAEALASYP